jgi:hypothetical protein
VPEVDAAANNCPVNDYTVACFMNSGTNWGSYQYFGGPSKTAPAVRFGGGRLAAR